MKVLVKQGAFLDTLGTLYKFTNITLGISKYSVDDNIYTNVLPMSEFIILIKPWDLDFGQDLRGF